MTHLQRCEWRVDGGRGLPRHVSVRLKLGRFIARHRAPMTAQVVSDGFVVRDDPVLIRTAALFRNDCGNVVGCLIHCSIWFSLVDACNTVTRFGSIWLLRC